MTPWKKGRNIVLAILFFLAGVTVASTVRRTADRDYGRLFGEQLPPAPQQVVTRTVPVVTEGVAPAAGPAAETLETTTAPTAPLAVANDDSGSIVITRPNGEKPRVVSGGIFKQQQ